MKERIKYPQVTIKTLYDGEFAFEFIYRASRAMRSAGISRESVNIYVDEAIWGKNDQLLQITKRYVNVI